MDANCFDALIRSLDDAIPRRTALGGALGTALISLLARFGTDEAEARNKRKKKKKCKGNKKKCGKKCFDLRTDPAHCGSCTSVCKASEICLNGACTCPVGEAACGGSCCPAANCIEGACCPAVRTCGTVCCAADELCGDPETATCVTGQGTCPVGADSCSTGNVVLCNANPTCFCVQTTAGETRCGAPIAGITLDDCGDCTTDADCELLFPNVVGVFCGKNASGPVCGCPVGLNICGAPCPG